MGKVRENIFSWLNWTDFIKYQASYMVCYLKVFPERTDNFGRDNYNEQPRYLYKKKA